jgi:hypothetical protein
MTSAAEDARICRNPLVTSCDRGSASARADESANQECMKILGSASSCKAINVRYLDCWADSAAGRR